MKRKRSSRPGRPNARHAAAPQGGKLRVIGGEFRRRQLPVPDRPGLRPTPDRVRETLFNWLGQRLDGERVLDAFAGTGALGIEALSRGAAQVTFIEQDSRAATQLERNLATLKADGGRVLSTDARAFLEAGNAGEPFDLVLLDPPFHQGWVSACCADLERGGWLAAGARIYLEAEATLMPAVPGSWLLHRQADAGDTAARLYQRLGPGQPV
ncbi:16S rRNA (guanine(966)-N(2))-methyltransferase RsmD [Halomonas piscis]|uniref:Ribosomal RNA small subunit methyltransferase D n=1 Tax=Halomonas piscis TaxID=3031727 RepID=A0ABY9Z2A9_9GAMM|nr:16S rRNA (guanine(966)-N(2))-methyltransferase RsmD [Halomonas piscis]WNK20740.1 16S rRNA (guanine(966)-N(2))-methyltransferase RsmD [Halomonas piscis]